MQGNSVLELRQYTLYGGERDTLIDLFEKEFIEPQEELGLRVLGTFRDMDDPDRFVWFRGFKDMAARGVGLPAFYGGPVWQEHQDAANATMLDSDNVLLLKPASAEANETTPTVATNDGIYGAVIHSLRGVPSEKFHEFFQAAISPRLEAMNVQPVATLVTETAANNFPRLPVRDGESVFLWMARWPDERERRDSLSSYHQWTGWRDNVSADVLPALMQKPELLRLKPTRRSKLR